MSTLATLTNKRQITIPQKFRRRLGLKQGNQVVFVTENGQAIMKLARREKNPFGQYVEALESFETKAEISTWLSDLRGD